MKTRKNDRLWGDVWNGRTPREVKVHDGGEAGEGLSTIGRASSVGGIPVGWEAVASSSGVAACTSWDDVAYVLQCVPGGAAARARGVAVRAGRDGEVARMDIRVGDGHAHPT